MSDLTAGEGAGSAAPIAEQAQEKVQQTAQQAAQRTTEMLRQQTEARAAQASDELRSVADALRRSGHTLHADGKESSGAAVDAVTDTLERLARYLGETGGDQMLRDVESFGRRRPWAMIGLGLGVGMAASRFLKASSRTRYQSSPPSPMQSYPARPALPTAEPVTQTGYVVPPGV